MRICQIVAYVSRDGAYGGPTTVAFAQCDALATLHEVTLLAGSDGTISQRSAAPYAEVYRRAFRIGNSFGGLFGPSLLLWLMRHRRSFDVVHVHLARDFTVMPAAMLCHLVRLPFVIQTHGMVQPPAGPVQRIYDVALTIPVVRSASRAFYLTELERSSLAAIARHTALEGIRNGVALPKEVPAQHTPPVEVLFCSRLHRRKRPSLFLEMAAELASAHPGHFRFRMVGPDGGALSSTLEQLRDLPPGVDITYDGAVPPHEVSALLNRANVLVLPSIDEPFPMIVLEALAHGVPVVIDATCGLAGILAQRPGSRVVSSTAATLATAVKDIEANLPTESMAARTLAETEFSIARLRHQLETAYQEVI